MARYFAPSLVAVFLDTGVLGMVTQNTGVSKKADDCIAWADQLQNLSGVAVLVPEIADYEQRREFLRSGNLAAIARLEKYTATVPGRYVLVDTQSLREAARLWAMLRNAGLPTASKDALDGDAILAGQVFEWCATNGVPTTGVAVATTNVSDLTRFTDANGDSLQAALWQDIVP